MRAARDRRGAGAARTGRYTRRGAGRGGDGADAVYLGAGGFNARDDGAQLTLDELGEACRLAHAYGTRIYFTLNVLTKPAELVPALMLLGDAIDRGIDAVIVQDLGLIRLIRAVYPDLEVHGSTQITVHDQAGAAAAATSACPVSSWRARTRSMICARHS